MALASGSPAEALSVCRGPDGRDESSTRKSFFRLRRRGCVTRGKSDHAVCVGYAAWSVESGHFFFCFFFGSLRPALDVWSRMRASAWPFFTLAFVVLTVGWLHVGFEVWSRATEEIDRAGGRNAHRSRTRTCVGLPAPRRLDTPSPHSGWAAEPRSEPGCRGRVCGEAMR